MPKMDTRKLDAWAKLRDFATNGPAALRAYNTERLQAITEARDAGWTFAQIGSALGVSAQAVHQFVHNRTTTKGSK